MADEGPGTNPNRFVVGSLLSALAPGLGQLLVGDRKRGVWLLAATTAGAVAAVVLYLRDPSSWLKLAFEPSVLVALLFANAAVFVFRTIAAVDVYRRNPRRHRPPLATVMATGIGVVLVAPHIWFAYYDMVQYDLITTVFAATTVPATSEPPATTVPTTAVVLPAGNEPSTTVQATTTVAPVTTTTEPPGPWGDKPRINILLLGSDAGVGRTGVRTDTMILASIDVNTGDTALIGVPRNLARVPVPDEFEVWSCDCFPSILNELYQYGESRPDSFPGTATPGANAIKGAIGELLGLRVDFYALVALDGFVEVVDAVGGVEITVSERVYDPGYPSEGGGTEVVDIKPGTYTFDGHNALAYARIRYGTSDYNRMGRQRCVLEAVAEQADPLTLIRNFPTLAEVIKASVETDIPLDLVPDLIDLLTLMDSDRVVSLRLMPPTYNSGWTEERFPIPDVELIREHTELLTTLSAQAAMDALGIDPLEDGCG